MLKIVVPNIPHTTRRRLVLRGNLVKPKYERAKQIRTPRTMPIVLISWMPSERIDAEISTPPKTYEIFDRIFGLFGIFLILISILCGLRACANYARLCEIFYRISKQFHTFSFFRKWFSFAFELFFDASPVWLVCEAVEAFWVWHHAEDSS